MAGWSIKKLESWGDNGITNLQSCSTEQTLRPIHKNTWVTWRNCFLALILFIIKQPYELHLIFPIHFPWDRELTGQCDYQSACYFFYYTLLNCWAQIYVISTISHFRTFSLLDKLFIYSIRSIVYGKQTLR